MSRQHHHCNHTGDDKKQFVAVASGDFRHSMCIPWEVGNHLGTIISGTIKLEAPNGIFHIGVCRKTDELVLRSGWDKFVALHHIKENYSLLFVYRGNSTFKVHIFNSMGHEKATSCSQPPSQSFGGVPPDTTCDHHVLNEQVLSDPGNVRTSTDLDYTILPGCHLTKAQHEKLLEIACTMRSEVPLYVAVMNKSNVNLKDCSVNLPLKLVEHFKEDTSKATIRLEAPDDNIYGVEACKHGDDQIVLQCGWNKLVVSNRIQENDLLVFMSKGKTGLEVRILGTSGHQRTSSCFDMGDISSTQEVSEDSLEITDLPAHTDYYVSSSDDDHIVGEGTRKLCRWQKQAPSRCAETQKVASTSSTQEISEDSLEITDPPAHTDYYVSSSDDDHTVGEGTRKLCRWQKQAPSHYAKTQKVASTSSTQETSEDSLEITDPPAHTDYYVSSSDDDLIVGEGTRKLCRWQKQAPSHCAKTQKVASTSSPSAKSGYSTIFTCAFSLSTSKLLLVMPCLSYESSASFSRYEAHKLNERAFVEFGVDLEPHSSSNLEGPSRPSQHPYILAEGLSSTLTPVEKKKIEEKVQAIQSELPIFVALMTKGTISANHLRFCKEYGSRYLPLIYKKKALVLQLEGTEMEWDATLTIDTKRAKWIRVGWQKFVDENKVREGDIGLFERAKSTEELRMTVHFIRRSDTQV